MSISSATQKRCRGGRARNTRFIFTSAWNCAHQRCRLCNCACKASHAHMKAVNTVRPSERRRSVPTLGKNLCRCKQEKARRGRSHFAFIQGAQRGTMTLNDYDLNPQKMLKAGRGGVNLHPWGHKFQCLDPQMLLFCPSLSCLVSGGQIQKDMSSIRT